ncbi:tRNA (guanine-N1)-methyltransferase [Acidobacteria bacterium Mor1]|nr:tRNA (guanine-N1)-methyltransferase [Acidobacteria bacterium Mor1]
MVFDVVTLFPSMFFGALEGGVLARARRDGKVALRVHDLRRFGVGPHRQVDDTPYGGGGGMVLRPEPFFDAIEWIRTQYPAKNERVLLLSPQGRKLNHGFARELADFDRVLLLSGRYEGVDERVREALVDEELSIGDMVLTGGELPALVLMDVVSRFVPGVLGREGTAEDDTFSDGLLEHPHYTRPARYRGYEVPEVLQSGDHGAIERWRRERAEEATRRKRPDLLQGESRGASREGGGNTGTD